MREQMSSNTRNREQTNDKCRQDTSEETNGQGNRANHSNKNGTHKNNKPGNKSDERDTDTTGCKSNKSEPTKTTSCSSPNEGAQTERGRSQKKETTNQHKRRETNKRPTNSPERRDPNKNERKQQERQSATEAKSSHHRRASSESSYNNGRPTDQYSDAGGNQGRQQTQDQLMDAITKLTLVVAGQATNNVYQKEKKKDCPAPEKFMGDEGETCDLWLDMFHEYARTQNFTPEAEVAALRKYMGRTPLRVLNNLRPEDRFKPHKCYEALSERWSHKNAREANRKAFWIKEQGPKEGLDDYMDELKKIRTGGWYGESSEPYDETVKNQFWKGLKDEEVAEQLLGVFQYKDMQEMTAQELLESTKKAKYVVEQKKLRNGTASAKEVGQNKASNPEAMKRHNNNNNQQQYNGGNSLKGKCLGCGNYHPMKECRNPFLLKGKDYVKAVIEMGVPEEELWALGQQTAEADYAAEQVSRCFDDGGLYALERRPGSCFKCGEQGHRAAECPTGNAKRNITCYSCGVAGHIASDCKQGVRNANKNNVQCYGCGAYGHYASACQSERKGPPATQGERPAHLCTNETNTNPRDGDKNNNQNETANRTNLEWMIRTCRESPQLYAAMKTKMEGTGNDEITTQLPQGNRMDVNTGAQNTTASKN